MDAELAAAPGPGKVGADRELFRKLKWLTLFRLVTITVLLGGTAFAAWREPTLMAGASGPLFRLVVFTSGASLGFALWLRSRRALLALAYAQIALDVGISAVVVALTAMIEPVMMVFLGGLVGGFLVAMYLPIFSIAGNIK